MIALLSATDPAYIHEAAKRGVFAYIVDADAEELQSAIEITLQRFAEFHNLQGAFGRRAMIEQAKGILMERYAMNEQNAFEMLRDHSQHNGRRLADVAEAIVQSHLLLVPPIPQPPDKLAFIQRGKIEERRPDETVSIAFPIAEEQDRKSKTEFDAGAGRYVSVAGAACDDADQRPPQWRGRAEPRKQDALVSREIRVRLDGGVLRLKTSSKIDFLEGGSRRSGGLPKYCPAAPY